MWGAGRDNLDDVNMDRRMEQIRTEELEATQKAIDIPSGEAVSGAASCRTSPGWLEAETMAAEEQAETEYDQSMDVSAIDKSAHTVLKEFYAKAAQKAYDQFMDDSAIDQTQKATDIKQ